MDFDDLDDAIEQRLADGDTEGMESFAFEKKDLKKFDAENHRLPPIPKSAGLWTQEARAYPTERRIGLRAFVFYGPGDVAEDLRSMVGHTLGAAPWMDVAVHEWPGHGSRASEPSADDLDALSQDAFEAIKPALDEVKEGAEFEGAPFAFIGRSVGCQIMTVVAKKVLVTYRMAPCVLVVMDRAPLQFPLLSEKGQQLLNSDPQQVIRAFNLLNTEEVDKEKWSKALQYACETRDQFFHKFECDAMLLKGELDGPFEEKGRPHPKSKNYKLSRLQIKGSKEVFHMPVENTTTVNELTQTVSNIFANSRGTAVKAFTSEGKEIPGSKIVESSMLLEGLEDFKHPRHTWPHPACIIGAGFYGIKMATEYANFKNRNVVMFDRHAQAGGDSWHYSATKFSRCQTDFGAFNIWYGQSYCETGDKGFGASEGGRAKFNKAFLGPGSPIDGTVASGAGTGVDYNPCREQILQSMRYCLKEYKMDELTHFQSEVSSLEVIGEQDWDGRCYKMGIKSLKDKPDKDWFLKASVVYHFPGAYDVNRIIDYPGEDQFGGQIGYGMGNGQGGAFVWDDGNMKGKRAAILGNGAFAVENVRSCVEQGASKVYIITRRKSLLCPRVPCWFCHQGPVPTPAGFLLDSFKPMYEAAGIEDPWSFYAVVPTNKAKTECAIKQSSRFGIGDVTFLCHALGLFEYRVGTLERCSHRTMHLSSGEKLENMDHICKALGLLGDPRVDKLHNMTHRVGNFVNGDWRRLITSDATGMDAQRFETFSAGPGACATIKRWYYMHQHPWEMAAAVKADAFAMFPVHKMNETQPDQTIYQVNVQYEMHSGVFLSNCLTSWTTMEVGTFFSDNHYKHSLIHTMHPTEKYLQYCEADWNRYQNLIKENNPGFADAKHIPYPYNSDMVKQWFEKYSEQLKPSLESLGCYPISPDGPSEDFKEYSLQLYRDAREGILKKMIPHLIVASKLLSKAEDGDDPIMDALSGITYTLKKDLTASAPDSAMDFDETQYDAWKGLLAEGYTFEMEQVKCFSKDLLTNVETWQKIVALLRSKR